MQTLVSRCQEPACAEFVFSSCPAQLAAEQVQGSNDIPRNLGCPFLQTDSSARTSVTVGGAPGVHEGLAEQLIAHEP